jgi:enoyl-CoA hydratase/carnithine racemase
MIKANYNGRDYQQLQIKIQGRIATITLDNAPVNVLGGRLIKELTQLIGDLSVANDVKVIVFDSISPDFFIAHVDINILDENDILDELGKAAPEGLNIFQAVGEMIRAQPQITIVKLKGIARGGGAEFVAAADMSFASIEKGKLGQCEALMGIIPGGGATQYLSSKMTRGRVLEIILGADLFDAVTAESYGWINRAIADQEIDTFVLELAQNIANLPEGVIAAMKEVVPPVRNREGFLSEHNAWARLAFTDNTAGILKAALQQGAQTVAGELKLEQLLRGM